MPLGKSSHCLRSLDYLGLVIPRVALQTAETTLTLLSATDALALGDVLPAVWADILVPEFKEIIPL